jgi:hypothetical protein
MDTSPPPGSALVREMRQLHDGRLPSPGREATLYAPHPPSWTLPCRVVTVDHLTVGLHAQGPLPYLALGSPVVLSHSVGMAPLDATLTEVIDPDRFVVRLGPLPEYRAHRRFALTLGVALDPMGGREATPFEGVSVDLSESGIRILISRPVTVGVRALLWLDLPGDAVISAIVETLGSVISTTQGGYEARLRFVFMPTAERERLRMFLHRMPSTPADQG